MKYLARISHTRVASIAFWGGDPTSRGLLPRLAALAKAATPAVVRQNATPSALCARLVKFVGEADWAGRIWRYRALSCWPDASSIGRRRLPAVAPDSSPCRRRGCVKCGLALISILLVAGCAGAGPEVRPLPLTQSGETSPFDSAYQAGKEHLVADRFGLAIVMLQKALAYDPLSVAALNALGAAYDGLHRPDLAKTYYAQALAIEPGSADTLNNMAVSASLAGDKEAAADFFARAANADPANSVIVANMRAAGAMSPDEPPNLLEVDTDANRPRLERTGLAEVTLTLPATLIQSWPLPPPAAATEQRRRTARPALANPPVIWCDFDDEIREKDHDVA